MYTQTFKWYHLPSLKYANDLKCLLYHETNQNFLRGWHMYVALTNQPKWEWVVQQKEILRQFILLFYPERPKDRPNGGNVAQKIINNSNNPSTGYIFFAQNHLLFQGVVCLSYLFVKLINDIFNMTSYNRDKFVLPVTIVSKYVVERKSLFD